GIEEGGHAVERVAERWPRLMEPAAHPRTLRALPGEQDGQLSRALSHFAAGEARIVLAASGGGEGRGQLLARAREDGEPLLEMGACRGLAQRHVAQRVFRM